MFRIGLLLSLIAVCLQIAVFLQPLLPKQYQIAPVCETITRALFPQSHTSHNVHDAVQHHYVAHKESNHLHSHDVPSSVHHDHHVIMVEDYSHTTHDHQSANHQCQYCTVLGHLVLPPELNVKEVLVRIQIRLIAYQKAFKHVYFVLQRLFLLPQGRAPPLTA